MRKHDCIHMLMRLNLLVQNSPPYCKHPAAPTCAQSTPPIRPMPENSRAVHEEVESSSNVHKCTVCSHEFNSLCSMQAHCVKVHKVKQSSSTTDGQHPSDSQGEVTAQGSAKCYPCAKAFASLRELRFHQFQCHKVSSMADVRQLERQTPNTVTENTGLNIGKGKDGDGECGDAATHNNKSQCVCVRCVVRVLVAKLH